jgi:hypothetical protein
MRACGMIGAAGKCVACGCWASGEWHQCTSSLFSRLVLDVSALLSTDAGALPRGEYDKLKALLRDNYQGHVVVVMDAPNQVTQLEDVLALPPEVKASLPWMPPSPDPPAPPAPPAEPAVWTEAEKARYDAEYDAYSSECDRLEAGFEAAQAAYEASFNADAPRRLLRAHALVAAGGPLHREGLGVFGVFPTAPPPPPGYWRAVDRQDPAYVRGGRQEQNSEFVPSPTCSHAAEGVAQHPEPQTFLFATYSGVRVKTADVPDAEALAALREDAEHSICPRPSGVGFLFNCAHGQFATCTTALVAPYNKTFIYAVRPIAAGAELSWDYKARGSEADEDVACNCGCGGKLYQE